MFLRIRNSEIQWPYGIGQLRADEPGLSVSDNPHDNELDSYASLGIIIHRVIPTDPPKYDPIEHEAREITPTVGKDGKWYQAWEIVTRKLVPAAPIANWSIFKQQALASEPLKRIMQEALSTNPVAAAALAPALMTVELVGSGDFATVWHAVASSSTLAPDEAVQFSQLAQACNLPVDFVQALDVPPPALNVGQEWTGPSGTLWRVAQAIDRNGRFLPNDESTEAKESLRWLAVRREN